MNDESDRIEINGIVTDHETRKIGKSNTSSILRFPHSWLEKLIKDGSEPFVKISRVIEPNGNWKIVIGMAMEEKQTG